MNNLMMAVMAMIKPFVESGQSIWVACSGGLDSTVLLHLLCQARDSGLCPNPLHALHVNHQLQPDATLWQQSLTDKCLEWQVPCHIQVLDHLPAGNTEANARQARYAIMQEKLSHDDVLLTGHHQRDQAETLLLQMLRGGGLAGLSAMPSYKKLGSGWLLRPLLEQSYDTLLAYARQHQLVWHEDPSNALSYFDRNYLRHDILPKMRDRWPAVDKTFARVAQHCADSQEVLNEVLCHDLASVLDDERRMFLKPWKAFSPGRRRLLLRLWLHQEAGYWPSQQQLLACSQQLLSHTQRQIDFQFHDKRIRRHQDKAYVLEKKELSAQSKRINQFIWSIGQALPLPAETGQLVWQLTSGTGIAQRYLEAQSCTVRFRRGGERCRPLGRKHSNTLKKLLQEYRVPVWLRDNIPLIYIQDELAAVGHYWICEPFGANPNEPSYRIVREDKIR